MPADKHAGKPLVVLGDMDFAPYESLVNGQPVGANVDLWRGIAQRLGRPLDFRLYQWADSQARIQHGESDVLSMMNINEERRKLFDFTRPTFTFRFPVFVKSGLVANINTDDLAGKHIAVKKGGFPHAIVENSHPGASIIFVDNALDGFRMVLRGEADGLVEEEWVGYEILRQNAIKGIHTTAKALAVRTAHIPVIKSNPDLLLQIDQAVSAMKASGEFDQILDTWASSGSIRLDRGTLTIIVTSAVTGLVLVILLGVLVYVVRVRRINAALTAEIAERKSLEDQLRRSQRMDAVGQLTGGIAHDFNNILGTMAGNMDILRELIADNAAAARHLDAINKAVIRASSLTSRLLAFSRKQTLTPTPTDIADLVNDLDDLLRRALGETVDLKIEPLSGLWFATIDRHQFENALLNLAINARDAMPGGGTLTITAANVDVDEPLARTFEDGIPGEYVKVTVSDTGTGMTPEVREKVFEPFFTTKDVGKGSGLGLSMVYGFVKQSKGQITLTSEAGAGTQIDLYLPRALTIPAAEVPTPPPTAAPVSPAAANGDTRILVVEDEEILREVPVLILRGQGYDVVEAKDGKEALGHLSDGPRFDLLFTDLVLPGGISGTEIAEQAESLQPGIKVLYTTGYADNPAANHRPFGPDDAVIAKPYRKADLVAKVREILNGAA
ncbi:MAG: transporter substrate-binding domain-containing protein [Rhodospirillales bacterium]